MFGQTSPQPGSLFGQITSASTAFGQTPAQPGSLFGQNAPQPGSLFGQNVSQSGTLFGQTPSQPGSLFGQRQPQTGSLFGQTQPVQSGFGSPGSLFTQSSGGISGATGADGFGTSHVFWTQSSAASSSPQNPSFGQSSGGFGSGLAPACQTSTASPGLFGQATATGFGSSALARPGLFGQSAASESASTLTSSSVGVFGQPVSTMTAGGSTVLATSTLFTGSSAFGQTTTSGSTSLFGRPTGGTSAFQSPGSLIGFRQPQTSTTATQFGGSFSFRPQAALTTASSEQLAGIGKAPSSDLFSQQSTTKPLFTQQTAVMQSSITQTSVFGQPGSATAVAVTSSSNLLGTKDNGTIYCYDNPPRLVDERGFGQTSVGSSTSSSGSGTLTASSVFKGKGLFGKKEKVENIHHDQQPGRSDLFGKKPSVSQSSSTAVVTVKQEPGGHHKSLFGKPGPLPESAIGSKMDMFERSRLDRQQVASGQESKFQSSEAKSGFVKQEKQEIKPEPSRRSGLFGKSEGKPTSHGLFGKSPLKDEPDRESPEDRGFRPRLPRVREEHAGAGASRWLFGKAESQSTRQSRGSDEGMSGRRPSLSRQLSEDNRGKVAIVCRNVPTKFNNNLYLRKHFSHYGNVTKVFPSTSKMQATIHFQTHEEAADAKRRGRVIARGFAPMTIFWSSYTAPLTPSSKPPVRDTTKDREPAFRSSAVVAGPSRLQLMRRRGEGLDEELESMSGPHDLRYGRKKSPSPRPGDIGPRSPEKRVRSASPVPSSLADTKSDKAASLSSFQGVIARSTTDQVHLLNQRDKYIRQNKQKKKTDLKKAFVGTCPDMCPEKERYDREDKRRLSYYEMIPGTENIHGRNPQVDHSRAVKEYLRSSPDQDEPLPHELRPIPVLQTTMTYLLSEVADQGQDGFWGDWFDFLWNRTRGIRKDITQQQLCDRQAVELIEKCARFHIFCSERLCEEDMHSFDAKINNENLTKCLQTLREFYHDLEKKQKIFCQNEAEFRAYTVLMNLNEGDILREVQQLRPEVRGTPEISFALQVYAALNNNNYVRFFRLVKQASFCCACIMHRYFTQVRNGALKSMMRGYGMGNKAAQIPLSELVRLLGFEDEKEACDFCEHYGFIIEDSDVILDKKDYLEPETAWLPRRSKHLIESKRMVSVGETINGTALPKFEIPQPSSSFDVQGRFKSAVELPGEEISSVQPAQQVSEARGHAEEVTQEPVSKATKVEPVVPESPPKPSNEHVKDTAKVLFWEVIDEMCKEISNEKMAEVKELTEIGEGILENTIYSTVKDMLQTISHDIYEDAQAEHQRALKQEREERRDRVAASLTEEFIEDVVQQQVLNLATIEIREVKAQLKRECIARVTEEINDSLVQEVMSEEVSDIAADVFEIDVRQRLQQLQDFEDIIKLSRAGKFLRRWKKEYKAVTKLKRAMLAFPSAPSMESPQAQLDHLLKTCADDQLVDTDGHSRPLEVAWRREKINVQISIHVLFQKLLLERAWQSLDLSKLVGQKLAEKMRKAQKGDKKRKRLNWKLVLYLPKADPKESPSSQRNVTTAHLCDWLKAKMSKGKKPPAEKILKTEVLSLYKSIVPPQGSNTSPVNLGICVRSISGLPSEDELIMLEEERCMLGADAVIFVLPANPPLDDPFSEYWFSNVQRLQELLEVKPSNQAFPLVIMIAVQASEDVSYNILSELLNLDLFIDQGYICDVKIVAVDFDENLAQGVSVVDPNVSEKVCEGIQWLADLSNLSPDLSVSYLRDCIEGILMEEYYTPVLQNLRKRKIMGHLHQSPDQLLELYNAVVQHLSDTLISDTLLTISWPVPEFTKMDELDTPPPYWNTEDQFEYLKQLIQSLKLPQWIPFLYEPQSWKPVREKVLNYVSSVVDEDYGPARVRLASRLNRLLHQIEVDFEETCYLTEGVDDCQPTFSIIPWADVMSMCIDYKLATLDIMDPNVTSQSDGDIELKVAYFQSELQNFVPPQPWRHIESDQSILDTPSVNTVIHSVADKAREKLAETLTLPKTVVVVDQKNLPPELKETKSSSSKLLRSLVEERRRSDHFQKYLENALKSDQDERATVSNYDEELSGESCAQELNWKTGSSDMFENSISGSKREFSAVHNDHDASMGTRLFGNKTIHFNEESCFGSPGFLLNAEKNVSVKRKSLGNLPQKSKRLSLGTPAAEISAKSSWENVNNIDSGKINLEAELEADIMTLPGRTRRQRLSEIYGDDKVMLRLYEPTISEDLDLLKDGIKANRRESDLFEKKLLSALQSDPVSTESF